jgi:hypothetical protein
MMGWAVVAFEILLSATRWLGAMFRRPDVFFFFFFDTRQTIANLAKSLSSNALNSPLL